MAIKDLPETEKTVVVKQHFGIQFMVNYDLTNNYFMPSVSLRNTTGNKYSQKYIQNASEVCYLTSRSRQNSRKISSCWSGCQQRDGKGQGGGNYNINANYESTAVSPR